MALHTARLIFTVIFLIFALAGLVTGYWFQALFWVLIAFAVGYPFVRDGRIDLYYEDPPTKVIIYQAMGVTPGPSAAPMPVPIPPGMPAGLQALTQGTF